MTQGFAFLLVLQWIGTSSLAHSGVLNDQHIQRDDSICSVDTCTALYGVSGIDHIARSARLDDSNKQYHCGEENIGRAGGS